jgi:hypothetical protein
MTNTATLGAVLASTWLALAGSHTNLRAQQMPAPRDSTRVVQMHDVKQLVTVKVPGENTAKERAARGERLQRIVAFARTFVTPPLAAEEDITALSGRYLVALARPEQQKWIAQLVTRNVAKGFHQIHLEIRLLRIPPAEFEGLMPLFGVDPEPATPTKPTQVSPSQYQVMLDDTQLNLILRAVKKTKGVEMVTAPSLLLNPMSPATVEVGTKINYIKDYEVSLESGKAVPHPVRDTLFDGLRIDASCGMVNKELMGVSFRYEERKVAKPIPNFETQIGVGNTVTVQLPASTVLELDQQLEMLDGYTAMLAVKNGEGPHLMFLVRASLVANKPMTGGR